MKKFFLLFLSTVFGLTVKATDVIQDFPEYRLENFVTVEEMQSLLGKTFYYYPSKLRYENSDCFLTGMFGDNPAYVTFLSIDGKTKKNKPYNKMSITVKVQPIDTYKDKVSSSTMSFTYYSGVYDGKDGYGRTYEDLRLMYYDKWKTANSGVIGTVFTDPLAKATYKVVDISLKNDYDKNKSKERLGIFYTVENSITGKQYVYRAREASSRCFDNDKAGEYYTYLNKVEKPSNPEIKFGETTVIKAEDENGNTKFSYKDNFISIIIFGDGKQFLFTLKNVSENTQKLIWDEAVFVGYNGSASKIMHQGIKYSQKEASQPASTIIRGASIDDVACPIANVSYDELLERWITEPMYPTNGIRETIQVQLMLPIQIKDVTNEYIFIFDLKWKYNTPELLNLQE